MNLLEILLGQVPEAVYFALFMIFSKRLDRRRGLLITLMTIEYILLLNVFPFSIWSHILYFVISYLILKILYKEKAQITDIFTLGIASIVLMVVSAICYFILKNFTTNILIGSIVQKLFTFMVLLLYKRKWCNIQKLYKYLWNRNDKISKIMKSTTFRCINLIVFNIMFYIINAYMLYSLFLYQIYGGE